MKTITGSTRGGQLRLPRQRGEVIHRGEPLEFRWNGRSIPALRGDTIASALLASGERTLARSFKYHRPRSVLTADFHDPNCMFEVDGEPNVRGAHRRVEPGMAVRSQNAWPSLDHDVKRVNALLKPFLPPGFYYKTFKQPRAFQGLYRRTLRRFSAGGDLSTAPVGEYFDKRFLFHDVIVAGGGPAGMGAALAAAEGGARVLVVEEEHELGGHLRYGGPSELALLAELRAGVQAAETIEVLTDAAVVGRYDHNWIAVLQRGAGAARERLLKGRPGVLVVASGLIERPYVFSGNDLPGVMLSRAARRLVNLYAVQPGQRAVVFSANSSGDAAATDLERAGVDVEWVNARDGHDLTVARGRGGVQEVHLADGRRLHADLLVTAAGWTAPTSLLNMAGSRPIYEPRAARFLPGALPPDVMATGQLVGDADAGGLVEHGRAIGFEATRRARGTLAHWRSSATEAAQTPSLSVDDHPELFGTAADGFLDYSEDVTAGDIASAADEGYSSIELVKRYTTATMGPVQGKLSSVNLVSVLADATGKTIEETGTTTWRPPYVPVTLGALAGRKFAPLRRTPMHDWHGGHGARWMTAGSWLRPESYGDPHDEVRNVRESVGVIDVSTLGKIDLRGPDVPQLLEFLYVNKWSKLGVGRVRYGAMCAEDGVVLDDGVTGRLSNQHYFMSTTSGGSDRVFRWIQDWLQTGNTGWRVKVTNLTDAYASMNVAGPRSREVLAAIIDDVDLAGESFPYMHVRQASIAGVGGCFMWRIGFTGELSYELHVPAGYGMHVWDAVMRAGGRFGIRPFGVEAQRTMRIEKGHGVVGQDTDAVTGPFGAGMGWAVKLEKSDFAGRPELAWQNAHPDEVARRLVGLKLADSSIVPDESCQLLHQGRLVGRITSCRWSPTLERAVALALVAVDCAEANSWLEVRLTDGRTVPAAVTEQLAQVDPEGARLRG